MPTVILSQRFSSDSNDVWRAAMRRGWDEHRATRYAPPHDAMAKPWCAFGELTFADIVASRCDLGLLDPPDDFLADLPWDLVQREITVLPVRALKLFRGRHFFKPANDKFFHRGVFERGADVPVRFVDPNAPVIISEVVGFDWEFRLHCIDGRVATEAMYTSPGGKDSEGMLQLARTFGELVLRDHGGRLPSAVVLDVGQLDTGAWAVVEANQAYASGIYQGANMDAVLDCILRSAGPLNDVRQSDQKFLRSRIEVE